MDVTRFEVSLRYILKCQDNCLISRGDGGTESVHVTSTVLQIPLLEPHNFELLSLFHLICYGTLLITMSTGVWLTSATATGKLWLANLCQTSFHHSCQLESLDLDLLGSFEVFGFSISVWFTLAWNMAVPGSGTDCSAWCAVRLWVNWSSAWFRATFLALAYIHSAAGEICVSYSWVEALWRESKLASVTM